MGYHGPPSKGCFRCRERRTGCDQRRPGCGQCEKRRLPCPGYREMLDLMFRDESSRVIKKAKKATGPKKGQAAAAEYTLNEPGPSAIPLAVPPAIPSAISSAIPESILTFTPAPAPALAPAALPPPEPITHIPPAASSDWNAKSFIENWFSPRPPNIQPDDPPSPPDTAPPGRIHFRPLPLQSLEPGHLPPARSMILPYTNSPSRVKEHDDSPPSTPKMKPRIKKKIDKKSLSLTIPAKSKKTSTALVPVNSTQTLTTTNPDDDDMPASPTDSSCSRSTVMQLMYALQPTFQERGTAFFFSRYVAIDEKGCHQRFDFIYDIWRPESPPPSPGPGAVARQADSVMASITAVGLVGLANMTRSSEIMASARKAYGSSLRLINAALRRPADAVRDTTMLSILIVGLFEMVAGADARNHIKAWQEHVNGAAELAKLRGVAQFRTRAGTKMFMMLCQTAMVSCLQQGVPMPKPLVDLRAALARQLNSPRASIEVSMPIFRVLQFRNEVKVGIYNTPEAVVDRLIQMDDEFEHTVARLPSSYNYSEFVLPRPHEGVYANSYHVYPTLDKANIWNGIRSCRLLIQETILTEVHSRYGGLETEQVPPRYVAACRKAQRMLLELGRAILASVPQHTGLLAPPDATGHYNTAAGISTVKTRGAATTSTPPRSPDPDAEPSEALTTKRARFTDDSGPTLLDPLRTDVEEEMAYRLMLLASAGNNIVWPLYHVGMSSVCSPSAKAYCVDQLEAIYNESGLRQASAIATIMQDREVVARWKQLPFL